MRPHPTVATEIAQRIRARVASGTGDIHAAPRQEMNLEESTGDETEPTLEVRVAIELHGFGVLQPGLVHVLVTVLV